MNIIIVDDDQLVALSLKTILEASGINVIAIGKSGREAIDLYKKHTPEVLLMDIRMDDINGLDAGKTILGSYPDAKILLLTTFSDDEYIVKAINIGIKGYILKQDFESIAPAITSVYNGQTVFGGEIMEKIPSLMQSKKSVDYEVYGLNEKEFEIIKLIADGLSNKEISSAIFLSDGTIRNYISSILEKLELRDRTQLACFYYKYLV